MPKIESTPIKRMQAGMPADALDEALGHASSNGYSSVIQHAIDSNLLFAYFEVFFPLNPKTT